MAKRKTKAAARKRAQKSVGKKASKKAARKAAPKKAARKTEKPIAVKLLQAAEDTLGGFVALAFPHGKGGDRDK